MYQHTLTIKGFFSIVLLALVDADYIFTYLDIGCQGCISDGGVPKNCERYKTPCKQSSQYSIGIPS